jgi:hypothetical protein
MHFAGCFLYEEKKHYDHIKIHVVFSRCPMLSLKDIPQNQLQKWVDKLDGYHGISKSDRSWICDKESKAYKLTLYCYLIGQGVFFVEQNLLKSYCGGYDSLIYFVQEHFVGKCIVSFTDLFFLKNLNEAFCNGKWNGIHESWLKEREDYLVIIKNRKTKEYRDLSAYTINIFDRENLYDYTLFLRRGKNFTSIIDFCENQIYWKKPNYTSFQLKKDFKLEESRLTLSQISLEEFYLRFIDVLGDNAKSTLN